MRRPEGEGDVAVSMAVEIAIAAAGGGSPLRDITAGLPDLVAALRGTMTVSDAEPTAEPTAHEPAVSVRKSLASPDHILSMIDGKPYKTLRRHLTTHGLTPAEYRERYGLKADYPMVAPTYSEARKEMALKIGLGRKPA